MSAGPTTSSGRNASVWAAFLLAIVGALIIGASWDKVVVRSFHDRGATRIPNAERRLTKANYAKIQPAMDIEEIKKLLGRGETVEETSKYVDAAGRFKKHTWTNNSHRTEGGTVPNHDGQPSEETSKEIIWQEHDRLISVTFLNDKVESKYSKGL
jgi:hypothetical protein